MGNEDSNAVLTPEEIEAAMAEIESLAPGEDGIPNLDDGSKGQVVAVPVPVPAAAGQSLRRPSAEAPVTDASVPEAASAEPQDAPGAKEPPEAATEEGAPPAPGLIGRLLSRLPLRPAAKAAGPDGVTAPDRTSLVYRILDAVLGLIDRPFARLSSEARHIVGIVGIATLVVSLLAAFLLPRLFPSEDAVSFLRDKRAELLVAPPEEATEAVEGDEASP